MPRRPPSAAWTLFRTLEPCARTCLHMLMLCHACMTHVLIVVQDYCQNNTIRCMCYPESRGHVRAPARTCSRHIMHAPFLYCMPDFWCSDWSMLHCHAFSIDSGFCCCNHLRNACMLDPRQVGMLLQSCDLLFLPLNSSSQPCIAGPAWSGKHTAIKMVHLCSSSKW